MRLKILLPILVVLLALAGAFALLATRDTVTPTPSERRLTAIRTISAMPEQVEMVVRSQGTVAPRTESQLIPEVTGPVTWTSPDLVSGGYFNQGDVLVRIDPAPYQTALERAHANVGRTDGEYEYAESELKRHQTLARDQIVSENRYEDARRGMRVAEANLRDAKAAREEAGRDLYRTQIRAPFQGRVREEQVDVGQVLSRGAVFATLYATDYLEVRLPIPDDQLAYFDRPLWQRDTTAGPRPGVRLYTRFAGREHSWRGEIVRTEGEIDPRSRMVHVVARVEAAAEGSDEPPLPVGLFVHAEIEASTVDDVYVLPRSVLWDESSVVIVNAENRLERREVEILRLERDQAFVVAGLAPGDRISVSPPPDMIEGELVEPFDTSPEGRDS
ncbi:MAG: efflux RND transporter periplasmic adaptor subunit [Acidobacteriota bacterium]|nr:efflux RND transporter periplasmic adaptor subunit [Acidobacteriota bacterium]